MFTDIDFALLTSYLLTYLLTDCEKKHFENMNYFIVTRVRSMGNSRKKYLIEFFFVLNWNIKPNRPTDETDSIIVSYLLSNSRIWVSCSHTHAYTHTHIELRYT